MSRNSLGAAVAALGLLALSLATQAGAAKLLLLVTDDCDIEKHAHSLLLGFVSKVSWATSSFGEDQ